MWNTLRRLGVARDDLEDLAHDVFVVVYRKLGDYDPARPIRPWLFGIAFRVAAGHFRKSHHARELPREEIEAAADGTTKVSREDAAHARDVVIASLAVLDLDQRAAFVLHDIDGYSAPEIADALDVSVNTVYSRIRLARAKFAKAARRICDRGGAQ